MINQKKNINRKIIPIIKILFYELKIARYTETYKVIS